MSSRNLSAHGSGNSPVRSRHSDLGFEGKDVAVGVLEPGDPTTAGSGSHPLGIVLELWSGSSFDLLLEQDVMAKLFLRLRHFAATARTCYRSPR